MLFLCQMSWFKASLVAQRVKNLPAMQETWVQSLGQEDTLEKGMATNASILAWRIPWTESLVGYRPWGHRVGYPPRKHGWMVCSWGKSSSPFHERWLKSAAAVFLCGMACGYGLRTTATTEIISEWSCCWEVNAEWGKRKCLNDILGLLSQSQIWSPIYPSLSHIYTLIDPLFA